MVSKDLEDVVLMGCEQMQWRNQIWIHRKIKAGREGRGGIMVRKDGETREEE